MDLFGTRWSRQQLRNFIGNEHQLIGLKALEAADGVERGNRLIDVRNGAGLRFYVSPDRGMDISYLEYAGIPIAWRSSVGDASPAYFRPEGSGWLRNFPGGLLVTGGLTQFGQPNEDGGQQLGLHGTISNIPASKVNMQEFWDGDQYCMEVSGELRETAVYEQNIVLKRVIRVNGGSNTIHIFDTVTNDGFQSTPHMMLYHFNFGYPLISPDSSIRVSGSETTVVLDGMNRGTKDWHAFEYPQPHYRDEVFSHGFVGSEEYGVCEVVNPSIIPQKHLVAGVSFRLKELPYLYNWKMLRSGMYVLGVEPANCLGIGGRADARKHGLPMLEPGESVHYHVRFDVKLLNADSVQAQAGGQLCI